MDLNQLSFSIQWNNNKHALAFSSDKIRRGPLGTFCIHNHHHPYRQDWSLESTCSESAEPSIQLAHDLAGQLLKFCSYAICGNAPTLNNNQRNYNPDPLAARFLVQWTRTHGSASKCLISGWWKLMQIKQKIFKCSAMEVWPFFTTTSWNFWHIISLSISNHRKQVRFFGPPCTNCCRVNS